MAPLVLSPPILLLWWILRPALEPGIFFLCDQSGSSQADVSRFSNLENSPDVAA
jgi:hypothetical protein